MLNASIFSESRLPKAFELPVIRFAVFSHVHSSLFRGTFLLAIIQKSGITVFPIVIHDINPLA